MASSKVVSTNPDLPRDSPISSSSSSLSTLLLSDLPPNTMDDLLKSIYNTHPHPLPLPLPKDTKLDDVWKDIVTGTHRPSSDDPSSAAAVVEEMTLEDFLTKAGAVTEDDVRGVLPHFPLPPPPSSTDASSSLQVQQPQQPQQPSVAKGKRRAVEEPLDKATLQKQRRMIKNRESAARSRERKQAYTTELEYLVQQLEEENARLLEEEAEKKKQRYKQLKECLIPIVEKPKPKRRLRRSNSAQTL